MFYTNKYEWHVLKNSKKNYINSIYVRIYIRKNFLFVFLKREINFNTYWKADLLFFSFLYLSFDQLLQDYYNKEKY